MNTTAQAGAPSGSNSGLSVSALFVAVGAVATGVGSLAATGLLGQIERNHSTGFSWALGLTVGGTFLAALATSGLLGGSAARPDGAPVAGIPIRRRHLVVRWWHRAGVPAARAVGSLAIVAGVILAVLIAVKTASDVEKPVIDTSVTRVGLPDSNTAATRTYLVDAETKANNLPARARVTILIDGLRRDADTNTYSPINLFHGKYGPNNDGVLDLHTKVQITRGTGSGEYDAVGVQATIAYSEQNSESNPCGPYAKKVSTSAKPQAEARAELDPGCVVMVLPGPVTTEGSGAANTASTTGGGT